jgi:magnesium-transporting ATPase (P-type)
MKEGRSGNAASGLARNWHAMSAEDVLAELRASNRGLTSQNAGERLQLFGANRLRPLKRRGPLARPLLQFHNVLIYVLVASAVITALCTIMSMPPSSEASSSSTR